MSEGDLESTKQRKKRGGKGVGTGNGRLTNAERALRDLEILRLKTQEDKTLREIQEAVGMGSPSAVAEALNRVLREHKAVEVDTYRELELLRMEQDRALLRPYLHPDLDVESEKIIGVRMDKQQSAIALDIKLSERISKLTGADAPAKQEVSGPDGQAPFTVKLAWPTPDANTEVVDEEDLGKES